MRATGRPSHLKISWSGLGALLSRSWAALGPNKILVIGSWPGQGRQGDWFRIAWEPNGCPKGAQESPSLFFEPQIDPKQDPKRIFDADALRNPLECLWEHLGGPGAGQK